MSQPTTDKGVKNTQLTEIIEKNLGHSGRMIAGSKTQYRQEHPKNKIIFNACIFDEYLTEVWYGDIDLTLDEKILEKIAKVAEQPFYITSESYRADVKGLTYKELENKEGIIRFNSMTRKCGMMERK